jgi:hypothetical protein
VSFALEPRAFARYDDEEGGWIVDAGSYDILVGASATDIRLSGRVTLA